MQVLGTTNQISAFIWADRIIQKNCLDAVDCSSVHILLTQIKTHFNMSVLFKMAF